MAIFDDKFPGNEAAFEKLVNIVNEGAIAFTGAGTSMPNLPSWVTLISDLLSIALTQGLIDKESHEHLAAENDILYVADQLSEAFGDAQLKNKVASTFSGLMAPTDAHTLLSGIDFSRYLTLNYDSGIEMALAAVQGRHAQGITIRQANEVQKWKSSIGASVNLSVLHWHGAVTHAEEIILTGADYSSFYEANSNNKQNLKDIFRANNVVLVGFGFSDPFVVSQLEAVMRVMPSDNKHIGIIGISNESANISLERKKFASKYKIDPVFYPVKKAATGEQDHSALIEVLKEIEKRCPRDPKKTTALVASADSNTNSYTSSLLSVGDYQIYCEPNLSTAETAESINQTDVEYLDLISGDGNICIFAPHEFGLTTLGKRMAHDIQAEGSSCFFRNADSLPNYRKKLIQEPGFGKFHTGEKFTLVLDNFAQLENERLIRELIDTFAGIRLVLLQRASPTLGLASDFIKEHGFQVVELKGLRRNDIRKVAVAFMSNESDDQVSAVVEKIYDDLLQLCIPLTPSNVIMYCGVLYKDGEFTPISRLQIVERFVSGALQRASDSYTDAFNLNDKIELVSAFCYYLFRNDKTTFLDQEWKQFCSTHKVESLRNFRDGEILSDLLSGRIVRREGNGFSFRYSMFFSYFVGNHIALRPSLLDTCINDDLHLALSGLVEVLCGIAVDPTRIVADLTEKLEKALTDFYSEYPISGICLHTDVEWSLSRGDDTLWKGITGRLADGAASGEEIDKLKTSIFAERRTTDQKVSIVRFVAFEKNVILLSRQLQLALETAGNAKAVSKISGTSAVLKSTRLAYEVATILSPMIAEEKYVSWNGFTYINLIESSPDELGDQERKVKMLRDVISALPQSISQTTANRFGSRKLGPVFKELTKNSSEEDFPRLLLFTLLIRSKPDGWLSVVKEMIASIERNDIFLYHMLSLAVGQYRNEANSNFDRTGLKEAIAAIKVRRDIGVKNPKSSMIKSAIEKIDASDFLS